MSYAKVECSQFKSRRLKVKACSNGSFTLARKCDTGSLASEGGFKRTVSCLISGMNRLCSLVFASTISNLRAMFFFLSLSLSLQKNTHLFKKIHTLNKTHLPHFYSDYLQFCLWGSKHKTLLLQCMSDPYLLLAYADIILFFLFQG